MSTHPSFKHYMWDLCEPDEQAGPLERRLHVFLMVLIFLNIFAVLLGSVSRIYSQYGRLLDVFEYFSVAVFSLEYLARLWSCTADPRYQHPVWGRLRYVFSPMALVDLAAIVPTFFTFTQLDLRFVRALRLVRLARLAKFGRYSQASNLLIRVLIAKREELMLTMSLLVVLALFCATAMFYAEGTVQPDKFPDIPSAMWWAMMTITTVGYGDVFPVTATGRLIAVFTSLIGILMIALPTGVFGAAFVEELNNRRKDKRHAVCPHCGKSIE